jgi:ankyrin repeat protein
MVEELGADIEVIGGTPGGTPLWISCLFGYHDIARLLHTAGANASCRDLSKGITVLHTLTQFSSGHEVVDIVNMALMVGVDINGCASNGTTPLHTTFAGRDYSEGAATQILLVNKADSMAEAPDGADT